MTNQWWQAAFTLTARGLLGSAMPVGTRLLDVELDFIDHRLVARTSDGAIESMSLCDQPLSAFYAGYLRCLENLGVAVTISPVAVEIPDLVRFDRDGHTCEYDPDWANRYFRALIQADRLLKEFRARFTGKASPVHLFWGAFDSRPRVSRGARRRATRAASPTSRIW